MLDPLTIILIVLLIVILLGGFGYRDRLGSVGGPGPYGLLIGIIVILLVLKLAGVI